VLAAAALAAPALLAGGERAGAAGSAAAQQPTPGALYVDGPSGRYLLGGTWLRRPDDASACASASRTRAPTSPWTAVTVPNAWNAGQTTAASYDAAVTWYRKDFRLPPSSSSDEWIVRFESINNSAKIWLNGHLIGSHTGAFLPFEFALPPADLNAHAVNRLVLRISDAHALTDLPPANSTGPSGVVGGWWNYGGILRRGLPASRSGDRLRVRPGQPAALLRDVCRGRLVLGRAEQQLLERRARRAADELRRHDRLAGAADDWSRIERDPTRRGCGSPRRCCGRRPRRTSTR